jgi:hypothetical protein
LSYTLISNVSTLDNTEVVDALMTSKSEDIAVVETDVREVLEASQTSSPLDVDITLRGARSMFVWGKTLDFLNKNPPFYRRRKAKGEEAGTPGGMFSLVIKDSAEKCASGKSFCVKSVAI